jgi:hypothetical protein
VIVKTAGLLPGLFAAAAVAGSPSGKSGLSLDPGPIPTLTVPSPPAPLAPPINPGYVPPPPNGLSPILTRPGPVITLPQQPPAPYAAPPALPGPIDQQKARSYRNDLIERQRQQERSGVSPADPRAREVQQQLNQPTTGPTGR